VSDLVSVVILSRSYPTYLQPTTTSPADATPNVCIPSRPLPARTDPTLIIDRTLPGHFKVYASTLPQSDELSSRPERRVTREIKINIAAGSPKTPGQVERVGGRTQTTFDDAEVGAPEAERQRRASTLVKDEFYIGNPASDLGMVLMEEPEDTCPPLVCDGSCRQRMKALKGGNSSGATVVRLMSRFLEVMVLDEVVKANSSGANVVRFFSLASCLLRFTRLAFIDPNRRLRR
jgi:hypothetical protein